MLKNYVKIALRNVQRHRSYAFINIAGLAVGMASCLLILFYVQDERSYDGFHTHADRIYRLATDLQPPEDGPLNRANTVGWPVGRTLAATYPEVERIVHLRPSKLPVKHEGRHVYESALYADTNFFEVFSFPLVKGNPKTALRDPFTLVITQEMERKYFGQENALGQTLTLHDSLRFTITGVAQDVPANSHLTFDLLASFETLCVPAPNVCKRHFSSGWFHVNMYNYVLLREGVSGSAFAEKIEDFVMQQAGSTFSDIGYTQTLRLEPLKDIYLRSDRGNALGPTSDILYIYILSSVALFILLIAGINFMNLATARSTDRAKEVGIRKVVGSSRASLVGQFLSESFLTCLLAMLFALGILSLVLPFFNDLAEKSITMSMLFSLRFMPWLLGLVLGIGLLGGLYPAFMLSAIKPVETLKGSYTTSRRGRRLRQGLVVFQFALSCALIVSTLVVLNQVRYMQQQDLGFDKEQVLVLDARTAPRALRTRHYETIKRALSEHPSVEQVSASFVAPGRSGWQGQIAFPEGRAEDEGLLVEYVPVDHDFVATFRLQMIAGRDFSTAFETDREQAMLINEAAVRAMGWATPEQALGKRLQTSGKDGFVVGVVKDYHHHGLQEEIGPMVLAITPLYQYFSLRITAADIPSTLAHLEQVWNTFFSGYPFDYFFLDEDYDRQYQAEEQLTNIFSTFSFLAILIACLGLFGLAAFTARQRTKEIGIRKTLGASVPGIVALLSKDFLLLVGIAFVVATPVAYLAMERWLVGFAYRIDLSAWIFLLAGVLMLAIALLTVSYQSIKAALGDPVKALRYE